MSLRVVQLVQSLQVGGLERMVLNLADRARRHDVETTVVAYLEDGPLRAALEAVGARVHYLAGPPGRRPRLPIELARRLRGADVLHTHHLGPFIYGAAAARLAGVRRHVHTEHSVEFYDALRRRVVGRAMRLQADVVCVGQAVADWRRAHLDDDPRVIPNGIPVPRPTTAIDRAAARARLELPVGGFVVGAVARLRAEKDLPTLVEAVARVPEASLVLVGEGDERGRIESTARRLGLADRVRLLGERHDVERILPAFDVIALSSRREGLPLALLEGMAHGLPLVATAAGEIPALAEAGAGRVSPVGDARALAASIEHFRDPARRAAVGAVARALVEARYSLDTMVRRYVELYRAKSRAGS